MLVATVALAFASAQTYAETPTPAIEFSDCDVTGSGGAGLIRAECGILKVAENPEQPQQTIDLHVVRVKALAAQAKEDALTVINGGPGGSSIDMYVDLGRAFDSVRRSRDIIIVDQRGTGRSNKLVCPALEDATTTEPSLSEIKTLTDDCLAALPGDPRYYTTSMAVRDLEAVRVALGYQQLNIYGVSYGTRVALHYLRRYPDNTRSVIIDGVLPPTQVLGTEVADNAQAAFDEITRRCADSEPCSDAFGAIGTRFNGLEARLRNDSVVVPVADPKTGAPSSIDLSFGHIAVVTRLLSYSPEGMSLLPLLIHEAANGNYQGYAGQAEAIITQLTESMAFGMHNAAVCSEDAPHFPARTPATDAYLGELQLDTLKAICSRWPAGIVDEDFAEPVASDKPVLVLSGEYDPITPPRYGEEVMQTLDNATHIVARGQGHGVVARGCMPQIISEFIDEASVDELTTDCVERLQPLPFFVSPLGPAP
ncbi:MAG: alpha/beta hydrolase [Pseudomonadaceae bacterium]|nr:alpha/beta hydrolase [Pseudomonadaceae bacterium]